jgi:glutamate racemase
MSDIRPIGIFDSGVGGISVLREAVKIMPHEDFIFLGDNKNAPYGTKSSTQIRELTFGNIAKLIDMGAKALIIACNTATGAAVKDLRNMYPDTPIVGIEPAIKPAALHYPGGHILVMATPMTLKQEKFKKLLALYTDKADIVPVACPGLMEYVERGELDSDSLKGYLKQVLFSGQHDGTIDHGYDAIVLGCTHYPFAADTIREIAGETCELFDGAHGTARELKRRMDECELSAPEDKKGKVTFISSSGDEETIKLMNILFNK